MKDAAFVVGFGAIVVGAGLLSVPAGLITGGLILLGLAIWGQVRNDS